MQGWEIFKHSAQMVIGNLNAALRISLVLYLLQAAAGIYFISNFGDYTGVNSAGIPVLPASGFWLSYAILMIVALVTSLWIAVGWHRFILLEENPSAVLPPFHSDRILSYLGKSILLGLILAGVMLVVGGVLILLLGMVAGATGGALASLISVGVAIAVMYRISLVLPAAAIGKSLTFRESWDATAAASGAVIQVAVIGVVFAVIVQAPQFMGINPTSIVNMIYTFVLGWVVMMVSVSVLTTLYGIYIEGREL